MQRQLAAGFAVLRLHPLHNMILNARKLFAALVVLSGDVSVVAAQPLQDTSAVEVTALSFLSAKLTPSAGMALVLWVDASTSSMRREKLAAALGRRVTDSSDRIACVKHASCDSVPVNTSVVTVGTASMDAKNALVIVTLLQRTGRGTRSPAIPTVRYEVTLVRRGQDWKVSQAKATAR
ncbi:hypothetical protein [Gemmatimonas sp.]|jgi:hypothetical protein|uniref:hypothetical protein n=1 Tax=Gemmatimonas sp. TaxID=1962908 RepID=UPI0037BEC4E4